MTSAAHPSPLIPAAPLATPFDAPSPARPADPHSVAPGDIAVGVVIGRASEYFDFFVYGIASVLVFPAVFFPFADKLQGLLYAFALFAVAFVVRPVGTLVGMRIQRRFG
ncbi:MAG: MFS transporter, partial [Burkholderiaceae bacterium]